MPTLFRLIVFCAIVAALFYGGMFALVTFVKPKPREITVNVPIGPPDTQAPDRPATTGAVPAAAKPKQTGG